MDSDFTFLTTSSAKTLQNSGNDTGRQHLLDHPGAHVDTLDDHIDHDPHHSPKSLRSSTSLSHSPAPDADTPRLHCRRCHANPCKDLTATMCGHIFCNRCVLDHEHELL